MSVENPPAFPRDHRHNGHNGMTLRDWFAGQAVEQCMRNALNADDGWDADNVAYHAYLLADAMLAARAGAAS